MSLGNLLQAARTDFARFASDVTGGFAITATISTPTTIMPAVSLEVSGLGTGTWMVFDQMTSGKPVDSRSDSFNIPEVQLINAGYPYKNQSGDVYVKGHKITITDGESLSGTFVIASQHYNATLGLVIVILGKRVS